MRTSFKVLISVVLLNEIRGLTVVIPIVAGYCGRTESCNVSFVVASCALFVNLVAGLVALATIRITRNPNGIEPPPHLHRDSSTR